MTPVAMATKFASVRNMSQIFSRSCSSSNTLVVVVVLAFSARRV